MSKRLGLELSDVAQVEGGVVRNYALSWNSVGIASALARFTQSRLIANELCTCFLGVSVDGKYGRKVVVSSRQHGTVSLEAERGVLIFLGGEILPLIKSLVAPCDEPWIKGVRRRRREQHFVWLRSALPPQSSEINPCWIELGQTRYFFSGNSVCATWQAEKGPDGLDRVVDEALRLRRELSPQFVRSARTFRLDWDWKIPQWRTTSHQTHWGTSYEGDLWGILELAWNNPLL